MENKRTISDLYQMQSLPLSAKITMTMNRIRAWYEHWDGEVYVSFSGGKDSTVLLDIVRNRCGYKDVPAVYVDTGLEYPEIRNFVGGVENVVWVKPKLTFKQVIEKYGYPVISKQQSEFIYEVRNTKSQKLRDKRLNVSGNENPFAVLSKKYRFLIDAPFKIGDQCCDISKKEPAHRYEKETGRKAIIGTMASESAQRTTNWLKYGCNAFEKKGRKTSQPMSFWTEQDVLLYIKENNLPIASVYGDIVYDNTQNENFDGQLEFGDIESWKDCGVLDLERPLLKTTGCVRTGCMFCMFGCTHKNWNNFELMKVTHPKQYEWIMRPLDEGGLGYKEIIEYMNDVGNLNIKY